MALAKFTGLNVPNGDEGSSSDKTEEDAPQLTWPNLRLYNSVL